MKSKKIILIPGWSLGDNSFGCTKQYIYWAQQYGKVKIIMPDEIVKEADMLLLPGGKDIITNQVPSMYSGDANVHLEYFDKHTLPEYINIGMPMLGICRGEQALGYHFGAEMITHLESHPYSQHDGEVVQKNVAFKDLTGKMSKEWIRGKCNSTHHQALNHEGFPDCLEILAQDADDLTIEAFRHRELPIYGVQFHPEKSDDMDYGKRIMNILLKN
jgi:putative glutamine amidotransferase